METSDEVRHADPAHPLVGPDWLIPVAHAADGIRRQATANDDARLQLAGVLGIVACNALTCDLHLQPARKGRFNGTLRIRSNIVQQCVVTLDPFDSLIDETLDVEFWPPSQIEAWEAGRGVETEADENTPDPESLENDEFDIGRLVVETLIVAIDPYPRAPEAELEQSATETAAERAAERPFASLEKLRRGQPD